LRPIDQEEFAKLDYQVMRHAFDSQNALGRLCDEVIYQNDLAARLAAAGLGPVRTEVPVTVSWLDFTKIYLLDLVVGDSAVYELKTAIKLVAEHDSQLLNYLFLRDLRHGKLINFRPAQVEARFINTGITLDARRRFEIQADRWRQLDRTSHDFRELLLEILNDWGLFLELPLYTDALVHLFGGEARVLQMVPMARDGIPLGNQRLHLLTPDIGFRLTAITETPEIYERQLVSLLSFTRLRAMHWINLNRHRVELVTLEKTAR
jgi:GxxExxY protein